MEPMVDKAHGELICQHHSWYSRRLPTLIMDPMVDLLIPITIVFNSNNGPNSFQPSCWTKLPSTLIMDQTDVNTQCGPNDVVKTYSDCNVVSKVQGGPNVVTYAHGRPNCFQQL